MRLHRSFRTLLPIAQLVICVIALWPSRGFLLFQISESVQSYVPVKSQAPSTELSIDLPSLTTDQQKAADRAAWLAELEMKVPVILNFPVLISQLPYMLFRATPREWVPRQMLPEVWRALTWPLVGIFFWWLVGSGIDALRAGHGAVLTPRITLVETLFAAVLFVIGAIAVVGILTSTPDDRRDIQFLALLAGALLWGALASLTIASRFLQWRIRKRTALPAAT